MARTMVNQKESYPLSHPACLQRIVSCPGGQGSQPPGQSSSCQDLQRQGAIPLSYVSCCQKNISCPQTPFPPCESDGYTKENANESTCKFYGIAKEKGDQKKVLPNENDKGSSHDKDPVTCVNVDSFILTQYRSSSQLAVTFREFSEGDELYSVEYSATQCTSYSVEQSATQCASQSVEETTTECTSHNVQFSVADNTPDARSIQYPESRPASHSVQFSLAQSRSTSVTECTSRVWSTTECSSQGTERATAEQTSYSAQLTVPDEKPISHSFYNSVINSRSTSVTECTSRVWSTTECSSQITEHATAEHTSYSAQLTVPDEKPISHSVYNSVIDSRSTSVTECTSRVWSTTECSSQITERAPTEQTSYSAQLTVPDEKPISHSVYNSVINSRSTSVTECTSLEWSTTECPQSVESSVTRCASYNVKLSAADIALSSTQHSESWHSIEYSASRVRFSASRSTSDVQISASKSASYTIRYSASESTPCNVEKPVVCCAFCGSYNIKHSMSEIDIYSVERSASESASHSIQYFRSEQSLSSVASPVARSGYIETHTPQNRAGFIPGPLKNIFKRCCHSTSARWYDVVRFLQNQKRPKIAIRLPEMRACASVSYIHLVEDYKGKTYSKSVCQQTTPSRQKQRSCAGRKKNNYTLTYKEIVCTTSSTVLQKAPPPAMEDNPTRHQKAFRDKRPVTADRCPEINIYDNREHLPVNKRTVELQFAHSTSSLLTIENKACKMAESDKVTLPGINLRSAEKYTPNNQEPIDRTLEMEFEQSRSFTASGPRSHKRGELKDGSLYSNPDRSRKFGEPSMETGSRQKLPPVDAEKWVTFKQDLFKMVMPDSNIMKTSQDVLNQLEQQLEQTRSAMTGEYMARKTAEEKIGSLYSEVDALQREKSQSEEKILELEAKLRSLGSQMNIPTDRMQLEEFQALPYTYEKTVVRSTEQITKLVQNEAKQTENNGEPLDKLDKRQAEIKSLKQFVEKTRSLLTTETKTRLMAEERIKQLAAQVNELKKDLQTKDSIVKNQQKLQTDNRMLQQALEEYRCRLNAESKNCVMASNQIKRLSFQMDQLQNELQSKKCAEQCLERLQADKHALEQALKDTRSQLMAEMNAHKLSDQRATELCVQTEQLKKEKLKFDGYTKEVKTKSKTTLLQVTPTSSRTEQSHLPPVCGLPVSGLTNSSENAAMRERINMLQSEVCELQKALCTQKDLAELRCQKKSLDLEKKCEKDQQMMQAIKQELALKNLENNKLMEDLREFECQLTNKPSSLQQVSRCVPKPTKSGADRLSFEVTVERSMHGSITKNKEPVRQLDSSQTMHMSSAVPSTRICSSLTHNSRSPKSRIEQINELIANSQKRAQQLLNNEAYNRTFNNNSYENQRFINNLRFGGKFKNDFSQTSDYSFQHTGPMYLTMRKTMSECICCIPK